MTLKTTYIFIFYMDKNKLLIVTHDETFHADDVGACKILETIFGHDNVKIVRSRDPEIVLSADITIDVGKIYKPEENKFDHHMYGEAYYFDNNANKTHIMSSIGMVYKKYGRLYLNKVIGNNNFDDEELDEIYNSFFDKIVKEIDMVDNGIRISKPKYWIRTNISTIVGLNNENNVYDHDAQFLAFKRAMNYCDKVFRLVIDTICSVLLKKKYIRRNNILITNNQVTVFVSTNYNYLFNSNVMVSITLLKIIYNDVAVVFLTDNRKIKSNHKCYDFRQKNFYLDIIFARYGRDVISNILKKNNIADFDEYLDEMHDYITKSLITEFNRKTLKISHSDGSFNYNTDTSSLVSDCMHNNHSISDIIDLIYMQLEINILNIHDEVSHRSNDLLILNKAIDDKQLICKSGRILLVPEQVRNIKKFLFEKRDTQTHLIIMHDSKQWCVSAYKNRCKISNVANENIIFIHHHYFCAATKTIESAIELCMKTLSDLDSKK